MNDIYMKKYVSYAYKLNPWIILIWKMYANYGWVIYIYIYIESYTFIYIMFECIKQYVDMINIYMIITLLWQKKLLQFFNR